MIVWVACLFVFHAGPVVCDTVSPVDEFRAVRIGTAPPGKERGIKQRMRYATVGLLAFALLGRADDKPILLSSDEIRFEGQGIKIANLWRASDNSAADMLIRWPAGVFDDGKPAPVSTHPFGFRIMVLDGAGLFQFEGGSLRELKPGAYLSAPPNVKHVLGCKAGGRDCVFFVTFSPAPVPPK